MEISAIAAKNRHITNCVYRIFGVLLRCVRSALAIIILGFSSLIILCSTFRHRLLGMANLRNGDGKTVEM